MLQQNLQTHSPINRTLRLTSKMRPLKFYSEEIIRELFIKIIYKYCSSKFTNQYISPPIMCNRLRALTRRRKFLSKEQTKLLSQACIMSTFKYCPLASMFCGKFEKKCFNKIYKHTLRLIALSD